MPTKKFVLGTADQLSHQVFVCTKTTAPRSTVPRCIIDVFYFFGMVGPRPAKVILPRGKQCDGGKAQGWNNCWLIVAARGGSNVNPGNTQHCESEDENRGTVPCYECLGKVSYFGAGSVPGVSKVSDTVVHSCGPRSP